MGIGKEFYDLMDKISYRFTDVSHLECALTHSSYSNEMKKRGFRVNSNESYEFLGDAVLELIISEDLFLRCVGEGEGALTKYRQSLVCESTLAKIAENIDLGAYLNVGSSEENTDVRRRAKVLADSLEALIAAVYLDSTKLGDTSSAKTVVLSLFDHEIDAVIKRGNTDYKSMLLQFVEKNSGSELRFEYRESGPEHKKQFHATAYINNNVVGEGDGRTKRAAEMSAAKSALMLFGISV
ncbi:MAG: ribonuclease III [Clostridia bacterium]|nr:ribonuclease III [Clostridia bacterium]